MSEHRWAVVLEGDPFDLESARELFGAGADIEVREFDLTGTGPGSRPTVLMANDLDLLDIGEAFGAAERMVDILNGILFALDGDRGPLRIGERILRRNGDGTWANFANIHFYSPTRSRTRFYSASAFADGTPVPPPTPPHAIWMREAGHDNVLADVLTHLSGKPDWFDLYKAFELMRDDINKKLGKANCESMGWPSKSKLGEFSASAQVFRHSSAKWTDYAPSTVPMQLVRARPFVRELLQIWLRGNSIASALGAPALFPRWCNLGRGSP
jgi:hypothetical protein